MIFDDKSRYLYAETYLVPDHRGRTVRVVATPNESGETLLGFHKRRQGQRLDHLANWYLDNPAGFWRISELNDAMLPEALSEVDDLAIPTKRR